MKCTNTLKAKKKLQHAATVLAEPETSRRPPPLRKSVCDDETEVKLENITLSQPETETPRTGTMRGRQPELERGKTSSGRTEINSNALGHMIATIITEISKEAGGLATFSRSLVSNSINNGQTGQPCVSMDLEENESHLHQNPEFKKPELNAALAVIKKTMQLDAAVPFNKPVDPVALGIPDYFDVIDTPMDFGTICNNLENGLKYRNASDVFKDVQWIWYNCLKYNKKGDHVLGLMKRVKTSFMKYWKAAGLDTEQSIVDRRSGPLPTRIPKSTSRDKKKHHVVNIDLTSDSEDGDANQQNNEAKYHIAEGDHENSDDDFQTQPRKQLQVNVKRKNPNAKSKDARAKRKKLSKGESSDDEVERIEKQKHKKKSDVGELANRKNKIVDTIYSRQSPSQLVRLFASLGKKEQKIIQEMGFGGLLECKVELLPNKLGYWIVDHMDTMKLEMHIRNHIEKIDKKCVSDVLGFPMGKIKVETVQRSAIGSSRTISEWRRQYPAPNEGQQRISVKDVIEKIKENKNGEKLFKLNVVVLIMSLMAEGIKCGTANFKILHSIKDINDIPNMDWCGYVLECLKRSKTKWRRDDETSWYSGPLLFIVVWYATFVEALKSAKKVKVPFVAHWNTDKLREIESWSMDEDEIMQLIRKNRKDEGAQTKMKTQSRRRKTPVASGSALKDPVAENEKVSKDESDNVVRVDVEEVCNSVGKSMMQLQKEQVNACGDCDATENVTITMEMQSNDTYEHYEHNEYAGGKESSNVKETDGMDDKSEKGENDKDEMVCQSESDIGKDINVEDRDGYTQKYDYSAEEFKTEILSHYRTMIRTYYNLSELMFMAKYKHPAHDELTKLITEVKEELRSHADFDACKDLSTPFQEENKRADEDVNKGNHGNAVNEKEDTSQLQIVAITAKDACETEDATTLSDIGRDANMIENKRAGEDVNDGNHGNVVNEKEDTSQLQIVVVTAKDACATEDATTLSDIGENANMTELGTADQANEKERMEENMNLDNKFDELPRSPTTQILENTLISLIEAADELEESNRTKETSINGF